MRHGARRPAQILSGGHNVRPIRNRNHRSRNIGVF
jgi:hypothetical protein